MTDLYQILEVHSTASAEEIKRAYRRLSKLYHPDHNPNRPELEQKFIEINKAYEILSDADLRSHYDYRVSAAGTYTTTETTTQETYTTNYNGWEVDDTFYYKENEAKRYFYNLDNLPYPKKWIIAGIFSFIFLFVGGFLLFGPQGGEITPPDLIKISRTRTLGQNPITGNDVKDTVELLVSRHASDAEILQTIETPLNYFTPFNDTNATLAKEWLVQQLTAAATLHGNKQAVKFSHQAFGFIGDTLLVSYRINDSIEDNLGLPIKKQIGVTEANNVYTIHFAKPLVSAYNVKLSRKEWVNYFSLRVDTIGRPGFTIKFNEALAIIRNEKLPEAP